MWGFPRRIPHMVSLSITWCIVGVDLKSWVTKLKKAKGFSTSKMKLTSFVQDSLREVIFK